MAITRVEVVYDAASGVVLGIEWPNARKRDPGESDDELLTRMLSIIQEHPSYVGKSRMRVNVADLPTRVMTDAQGDPCHCRTAFRVTRGVLATDMTKIAMQTTYLPSRLRAIVPLAQWPDGVWSDLVEACRMYERAAGMRKSYDVDMMKEVRRKLLAATTGQVRTDVQTTFDEKRVPA